MSVLSAWTDFLEAQSLRLDRQLGRRVLVFGRTDSTNSIAGQHADNPAHHGLVVLADEQSAGRGRRGNSWSAKSGQSILLSALLFLPVANIDQITLLAGLAVAEALEPFLARGVSIKWPNDILVEGRKLAGILVETRVTADSAAVVVGLGVNVSQSAGDFPAGLRGHAGSLYMVTGRQQDRLPVIDAILTALEARLTRLTDSSADWLPAWKSRCALIGQTLPLESAGMRFIATIVDIDPLQGLVVRDDTGVMRFLPSATTTLSAS